MAMPVTAPVSGSVTLAGPLPMPTSEETSVPTAPLGGLIGASDTSSRNTDLRLVVSLRLNCSVDEVPVAVTIACSSIQPWLCLNPLADTPEMAVPFQVADSLAVVLVFDDDTKYVSRYCSPATVLLIVCDIVWAAVVAFVAALSVPLCAAAELSMMPLLAVQPVRLPSKPPLVMTLPTVIGASVASSTGIAVLSTGASLVPSIVIVTVWSTVPPLSSTSAIV